MLSSKSESPEILIPRSNITSENNKTGSWRFMRPSYQDKTAPCSTGCPAGEDIAGVEILLSQGYFSEAWDLILRENPFPAVCGRICYHPCETKCNRGEFDHSIAIRSLERFLSDTAFRNNLSPAMENQPDKKKKIAVLGAGPAGLSAAYFLRMLGYSCEVFEKEEEPGGILRWGLPEYRLPREILDREIARVKESGFKIHCNKSVEKDLYEKIKKDFDGVFIGCGHGRSPLLSIPGEELPGVGDGLEFLRTIARGKAGRIDGLSAVIGGGNTALDVARSVIRLGGRACIIYRRPAKDMPAFSGEIKMALDEGVEIMELFTPEKIVKNKTSMDLVIRAMEVVSVDDSGRAMVAPRKGKTSTVQVSHIFRAIGALPSHSWQTPAEKGDMIRFSNSIVALDKGSTPVVFGGDLTADVRSVVNAVASGKEAAMAMDIVFREGLAKVEEKIEAARVGQGSSLSMEAYLGGARKIRSRHVVGFDEINIDYFEYSKRMVQPTLLQDERAKSFEEIELKVSAGIAMKEAERCFKCGLCNQCDNCFLYCPDLAVIKDNSRAGRHISYDYCKGCGICVNECPRNAMFLEEEKDQ